MADIAESGTSDEYESLYEIFDLCAVPTGKSDVQALINTLDSSLGTMAMVDYPYAADFVEPMPAWPVSVSCEYAETAYLEHEGDSNEMLYAIAAAGSVFYNYAGQLNCLDTSTDQGGGLDGNGWAVQACNEMVMPFASNETTSMFPPGTWNTTINSAYCFYETRQVP